MGGTDRSTSLRSDERSTSLKSVFHIPEIGVPLHRNTHKPTLILVTHGHDDHFAPEAVAFVETPTTRIVVPESMESEVPGAIGLANGETATIDGVTVEAIPMYNIRRGLESGGPFHLRGEGNGYVVTVGGERLYVAGGTQCVPEVPALEGLDL
ncbi:MAG: MBL fold metallo-hydrolase, partial [Acidobacteria bacterium]|nr:MBL fold metallo-hydrolase [Acidobacteriota bacterium]